MNIEKELPFVFLIFIAANIPLLDAPYFNQSSMGIFDCFLCVAMINLVCTSFVCVRVCVCVCERETETETETERERVYC